MIKKMIFGVALATLLNLFSTDLYASEQDHYQPHEVAELSNGDLVGGSLIDFVSNVSLRSYQPLGYKRRSKKMLFGKIDLEQDEKGFFVKDVYCNIKVRTRVGPNKIPLNDIMNAEHTWPQSKGSRREPFRGDLHHLFPTDSRANSTRSSHIFSEVKGHAVREKDCTASKVGKAIHPETGEALTVHAYQPPPEHRGNVARAIFYAVVSYGYRIGEIEEYYLKKWHLDDPVDELELERNTEIQDAQGNRNPFIDFPNLVGRVSDF